MTPRRRPNYQVAERHIRRVGGKPSRQGGWLNHRPLETKRWNKRWRAAYSAKLFSRVDSGGLRVPTLREGRAESHCCGFISENVAVKNQAAA